MARYDQEQGPVLHQFEAKRFGTPASSGNYALDKYDSRLDFITVSRFCTHYAPILIRFMVARTRGRSTCAYRITER
jgi:hypothetical protein